MQKGHPFGWPFCLKIRSGSSLLSHGETPHYHRRYGVSLLSSAWGQVGPPRYCRQTNSLFFIRYHGADTQIRTGDLTLTKGVLYQLSHISNGCPNSLLAQKIKAWQFPTLTWGDPTLPSALRRFTAEFGMGSGGTAALSPPGIFGLFQAARLFFRNHPNQSVQQAENRLSTLF